MEQTLGELLMQLLNDSGIVANLSAVTAVAVYIVREVGFAALRRKLNIKDVEINEVNNTVTNLQGEVAELTKAVKVGLQGQRYMSNMFFNAFQNSKLPQQVKDSIRDNWSHVDNLMEDAAVAVTPIIVEIADDAKEKLFDKVSEMVQGNEFLEKAVEMAEDAVDDAVEDAPDFISKVLEK